MTIDHDRPEGRDEQVTEALRALFAPPQAEAYWSSLQARVMARVRAETEERGGWWGVLAEWAPAGLAAAAAAMLLAGLAVTRSRADDAGAAYDAMIKNAAPLPVQTVARPLGVSAHEATFRYVISY